MLRLALVLLTSFIALHHISATICEGKEIPKHRAVLGLLGLT